MEQAGLPALVDVEPGGAQRAAFGELLRRRDRFTKDIGSADFLSQADDRFDGFAGSNLELSVTLCQCTLKTRKCLIAKLAAVRRRALEPPWGQVSLLLRNDV